ncbi:hypothetical protein PPERSA_12518 [Pseudocohnilembus persalinus]|uniref:Uncharacterized protein n=1 Tax=Pseudocohnilembus persalinus TaxID=266149 RepID=A0A0V0QB03_PSEPJ|nr:hypothetical protein PPERSA_12518 [Pseudocohnilembus persalinus]|eukprot:KRW99414.1 hypothetical protein PPERSA_12518 [Pseudocohnilembus persalinus]
MTNTLNSENYNILYISETIQSSSLSFQSVNNINSSNSFSSGVFSISNSVSDNVFQEGFQDLSGVVINERGNSFDSSSSGQSSDGGFVLISDCQFTTSIAFQQSVSCILEIHQS